MIFQPAHVSDINKTRELVSLQYRKNKNGQTHYSLYKKSLENGKIIALSLTFTFTSLYTSLTELFFTENKYVDPSNYARQIDLL